MNSIWLVKLVLQFYIAIVVGFVSRHGLTIEAYHRNKSNKSKLVLY